MKITSIEQSKDKDMMRVFIDNHYAFAIPQEEYIRNGLYEEEEISEDRLQFIRQNILVHAARERAVRFLTIKDRSEGELIKKLNEAGFDADVAKAATEALITIGYLNDTRYAMKYLNERVRNKALSKKALRFELEQKGISSGVIDDALAEFETDDEEVALRAAKKKFGKYDLNDPKIQQKIFGFLAHRGFSFEIGKSVLRKMKHEPYGHNLDD